MKIQGLSLLGHIVKSEPAWIYKITNHNLMKELLKLLKVLNFYLFFFFFCGKNDLDKKFGLSRKIVNNDNV